MRRQVLALFFLATFAFAGSGHAGEERRNLPIELKANELHSDNSSRTATFLGQVMAKQGDVTIYSDRLVVHYGNQSTDVDKIEATGNVSIVQGNRRAQAEHALYENRTGIISLDGNPSVTEGTDRRMSGRIITYYLDQQKSSVTGGPEKRVEVTIQPRGKDKDGSAKR